MDTEKIIEQALKAGFTLAAPLDPKTIELLPEVRKMCEANTCHAYGTNWASPPACGTLEECAEKVKKFSRGIIVQTTGVLEDDFDSEAMLETSEKHKKTFSEFYEFLMENHSGELLALGAGGCTICKECTYPDEPCRFPDKMIVPMEGYGIFISDLCTKNNIKYNHGKGTITYVGCYLFK